MAIIAMMVSCSGSSGSSGVKKNEYLGALPAIYAGYNAEKAAHEAKMEEQGTKLMAGGEKNTGKIMKLMKEDEEKAKAMKEKMQADAKAEIAKIAGKEVPVSYSQALVDSENLFYNVAAPKLIDNDGKLAIAFSLSVKQDFTVPKYKGLDYAAYFRLIASDGSTIIKSVILPVKTDIKELTFTAKEPLTDYNFPVGISGIPEKYADFAGVEFITKDEYNAIQ